MAASKALKDITDNLEEQLTCSLCLDVFNNPKTLPCQHSFCTRCIARWFQKGGNPFNNELACPLCKTTVVVPDGDPSKLSPSFYFDSLLQLLHAMKNKAPNQPGLPCCVKCDTTHVLVAFCAQCNGMICEACFKAHKLFTELQDGHQPIMLIPCKQENDNSFIRNQMLCKEPLHEKEKLLYHCETCARYICQRCDRLIHQNHKIQSLDVAGQDSRKVIKSVMNRVEKRKQNYRQELKQSEENIERIKREISEAERDVDDAVKIINDMAKEHGKVMKNELRQTLHEQTTANDEEQKAIKTRLEESDVFLQQCQAILERDVPYEEIETKQMFLKRGEMLLAAASVLCGQSIKRDETIHYSETHVMQSLQDIGKIVRNVTDPTHSAIQLFGTPRGFINEFNVVTWNAEEELCPTRIGSIDVRIKDVDGKEVENKVSEQQPGKYCVSFQPQQSGQHEIQVKIGGEAIKNSPQKVNILDVKELLKPLKSFGGEGSGRGQLSGPLSIAVSNSGEIAIGEIDNRRIQIFNLDGKHQKHFGSRRGSGEFRDLCFPSGLVLSEDRLIVSDGPHGKGRIQELDLNGSYVRTIYRPEQWFTPRGMCVNDDGNIAVCCWGNQDLRIKPSIKVWNKQGDMIHEFDKPDNDEQPCYITYGNGKYFVSYPRNNCVRVFDVNGVFLYKFGEKGERDGQFHGVGGLAVYGPDTILVCDTNNDRVQLFTQEGQFIRSFGSRGSSVGPMECPVDVGVTADGRVFVVETDGNRVSAWY